MADKWEEAGVSFRIITPDMFTPVIDFMWQHFYPDEPISRSLGMERNWLVDQFYLLDSMKDGSSIVALDR